MQPPMLLPCPHCGASFQLTPEYLAQYGGQTTRCSQCGQPFALPEAQGAVSPAGWGQPQQGPGFAGQPAMAQPAQVIPYASPAYGQPAPVAPAWSQGNLLVARKGARLGHACVKCGGPSDGKPLRKTFYWHESWVYALILVGPLIYVIVALVVRQSGQIEFALCSTHRTRRRIGIAVGLLGFFAGIGMFIVAGVVEEFALVPFGIVILLGGAIAGLLMARVLSPTKIDPHFLWLKGAGHSFLETLPSADAYNQHMVNAAAAQMGQVR